MGRGSQLDPDGGLSLDQLIAQIDGRLTALRPLVREFEQLEAARAALVADYGTGTGRARRSLKAATSPSAQGRRAPRGANRAAILRLAGERPGITVAEIAQKTGIGKPTVHSTVYALTRKGELQRAGDGVKLAGGGGSRSSSSSKSAARAVRRRAPARRPTERRRPRKADRASAARRAAARRRASATSTSATAPAEAAPSMPPGADGAPEASPLAQAGTVAGAE